MSLTNTTRLLGSLIVFGRACAFPDQINDRRRRESQECNCSREARDASGRGRGLLASVKASCTALLFKVRIPR